MSCDLNPQPVSSGNGFDYNSIKNSVTQNLVETQSKPQPQAPASVVPRGGGNTDADDERTEQILNNTRRLSRFSPFCPPPDCAPLTNGCTPRVPRALGKSRFDA